MPLPWLEQCGTVRAETHPPPAAAMSTPAVPRELQLPPSQRAQPEFRGEGRGGGSGATRRSPGLSERVGTRTTVGEGVARTQRPRPRVPRLQS